jgi:phosphoglycolate phosphatase-like HAD superfamily hydrolase/ADP-ribose pyrophosphatase YjhB (NUDIX family)
VVRNIIFDWSGTLVDDLRSVWLATNAVFRKAGAEELSFERFRSEFSLPYVGFYARYVSHVPASQLERWFRDSFEETQDFISELPHARCFLQFCRARSVQTFVLSAVFRNHYQAQAERIGFHQFIDHPYVEVRDKRRMIGDIIQKHQLRRDETLFVGDMQHDIEAARDGRVFSCAVLTGYNRLEQLQASRPDVIVENLSELMQLLESDRFPPGTKGQAESGAQFPVATVGGLIFNADGEVLMIRTRKWSDLWGIPGGKIKYGESAVEALERELKEETGLDIDDIRLVLAQDSIHSKEFYRDAHFVLLNYTCRTAGNPKVQLNEEAQEFRWVTLDDALSLPLNRPTRVLIEAVMQKGKSNG